MNTLKQILQQNDAVSGVKGNHRKTTSYSTRFGGGTQAPTSKFRENPALTAHNQGAAAPSGVNNVKVAAMPHSYREK